MYYIGLKQTYTLQTVLQVGKIVHFAKCLEFAAFKVGWECSDSCFEIKWIQSIQKQVTVTSDILKEKKLYFIIAFSQRFYSVYMLMLIYVIA